jgi:hypothetical protein
VLLLRADRELGRVWLALGALPFALAAVIGLVTPFFLDRTLTLGSWAPPVAVAFLADAAFRRGRAFGLVATVVVLLVVAPSTVSFIEAGWEYDVSGDHLTEVVRAGDEVAVVPAGYASFVEWRVGVRGAVPGSHAVVRSPIPDAVALVVGKSRAGDRIWLVTFHGNDRTYPNFGRCAPPWDDGVVRVLCLRARQE